MPRERNEMSWFWRERNEIYRRWKAGENHVDLAQEFKRSISRVEAIIRAAASEDHPRPKGPSSFERHQINKPRDRQIVLQRAAGKSWRKIADQFKLSPERIRQIHARHLRRTARVPGHD